MKLNYYLTLALAITCSAYSTFLRAQIDLFEPGTNSAPVNKNVKLLGSAKFTAGSADPAGRGYIRLTGDVRSDVGGLIIDEAFPSNMGVVVEFEYLSWTKNVNMPADGTSIFLFDARYNATTFKLGAVGSGLGYGGPQGSSGATGGYIALGLDEYGNWGKPYSASDGGLVPYGRPNISVRGSSPTTPFIKGRTTADIGITLSVRDTPTRPSPTNYFRQFRIAIMYNASGKNYNVSVYARKSAAGSWERIIDPTGLTNSPPSNLKVGIAASTGTVFGHHEIRNLRISTPGEIRVTSLTPSNVIGGRNTTYSVTVHNDSPSMLNGVNFTHVLPKDFVVDGLPSFTGKNSSDALISGAYAQNDRYGAVLNLASNSSCTFTFTGKFVNRERTTVSSIAYAKAPPKYTDNDVNNDTVRTVFTLLSSYASFGDAPASYGVAEHRVDQNLYLGGWDSTKTQTVAIHSDSANTSVNDDAASLLFSGGYTLTDHSLSPDFYFDTNRRLTVSVPVNAPAGGAKLIGWIDFNRDGRFEASEAAEINVTASNKYNLTFNNVSTKIRNGITYMRFRLSTDKALTTSTPSGFMPDGDVEDYLLHFKAIDLNINASPAEVKLGEDITYSIEVLNNCPFPLGITQVFDTLSSYVTYVVGTASPNPTNDSPVNINPNPNRRQLIKWSSINVPANGQVNYSLRAKASGLPQQYGDQFISNRAAVLLNGANILSLNTANTAVKALEAVEDLAITTTGLPIAINLVDNDLIDGCNKTNISLLARQAAKGSTSINARNDAIYTPDTRHLGIDSFTYVLTGCLPGNNVDSSRAYVLTLKPDALKYLTCPGASATLGMQPIADVSYYWFDKQTDANPLSLGSNVNNITVTNLATSRSWWVEARWRGKVFPRYEVVVDIDAGCGDTSPTGCAVTGTLIWKEDFDHYDDGLNTTSPVFSRDSLAAGMTTYAFAQSDANVSEPTLYREGTYALIKLGLNYWPGNIFTDDHTSPGNNNLGRFFIANGKGTVDKVYTQTISNLCPGTTLYLSFWMRGTDAIIRWNIHSASDSSTLASFLVPALPSQTTGAWLQYGFKFTVPDNVDSVYFDLYNYCIAPSGNDFAIDDIEVRLCVSPVIALVNGSKSETVCYGDTLSFTVDPYTDDGILVVSNSAVLEGFWIKSSTGDLNKDSDWSIISGTTVRGTAGGRTLTIPEYREILLTDSTMYYRFVVMKANSGSGSNISCRAISDMLTVEGRIHISNYPDIRLQLCPNPSRSLYLSSYLDTIYFQSLSWNRVSQSSPAFRNNSETTTGELLTNNFQLGTHIYQYKIDNLCASDSARLYIKVLSKSVVGHLPDTVIVCRSIHSSAYLQLNQILGIEANGVWDVDQNLQPFVSEAPAQSYFRGAYIFDAQSAWQSLSSNQLYNLNYKGDANSASFKFTYNAGTYANPVSDSCVGNLQHELVIVVTSRLL